MSKYRNLHEVVPAGSGGTCSPVWAASISKEEIPKLDGAETLYELFSNSVEKYPDRACLGFRRIIKDVAQPYEFFTYQQVADRVDRVGSAFAALGLKPNDKIGVLGPNCPEWMLAMQGCNRMSMICVPLYETLGENAIEYIIDHSGTSLVLIAAKRLGRLTQAVPLLKKSSLRAVVYWGEPKHEELKALKETGLKVMSFADLERLGSERRSQPHPPKPQDLSTIMYTSGTTGDPKGVMLTHEAIVTTIASCDAYLRSCGETLLPDDCYLSFLPLAHVFDRVAEEFMLYAGGAIGYWQGEIPKVLDDIQALRPTLFCGVPRVFDRIYAGIQEQLKASFLKRMAFKVGVAYKKTFMKLGYRVDEASPLADYLIFDNIKHRLGGRVRVIISGAAPLARHVQEFLSVVMCAPLLQGYGLTETCAATFIAEPYKWDTIGTVGAPLPGVQLRLEAVPEMGYLPTAAEPAGEVCLRGPSIFKGYYKQLELTEEVLDSDGFFHTGDIGVVTGRGALKIVDRKKNIFKLAQGEYVAVEKLESSYKDSPLVDQVWVYGNSLESCLVAVVVPLEKNLMQWAKDNGVMGTFQQVCSTRMANTLILKELTRLGQAARLKGFEMIKAVYLDSVQFNVDNNLLTPTFKLKRAPLQQHYQKQINQMYMQLMRNGVVPTGAIM